MNRITVSLTPERVKNAVNNIFEYCDERGFVAISFSDEDIGEAFFCGIIEPAEVFQLDPGANLAYTTRGRLELQRVFRFAFDRLVVALATDRYKMRMDESIAARAYCLIDVFGEKPRIQV